MFAPAGFIAVIIILIGYAAFTPARSWRRDNRTGLRCMSGPRADARRHAHK